jgi:hypothetical protein
MVIGIFPRKFSPEMQRQRTYDEAAAPFLAPAFLGDFFPPAFLGLFRFLAPADFAGRPAAFFGFLAAGPPAPDVAPRFGFGDVAAFGLAAGFGLRGVLRVFAVAPFAVPFGRPRPFFDGAAGEPDSGFGDEADLLSLLASAIFSCFVYCTCLEKN